MTEGALLAGVLALCLGLIKQIKDLLVGNSKSQRECDKEILKLKEEALTRDDELQEWKRRAVLYRSKYRQTDHFIKTYLTDLRQSGIVETQTTTRSKNAHTKRKSD